MLALAAVAVSLLAVGAARAYLTQGQVRLARLEQQLNAAQGDQRALEVQVAQLESPSHVISQAEKDGLGAPKTVTDLPLVEAGATSSAASNAPSTPTTSSSTASGR